MRKVGQSAAKVALLIFSLQGRMSGRVDLSRPSLKLFYVIVISFYSAYICVLGIIVTYFFKLLKKLNEKLLKIIEKTFHRTM